MTNGRDVSCGFCGGDALEVTPAARYDDIIYDVWKGILRDEGKPNPTTGDIIEAMCGYCVEVMLNKPSRRHPEKTMYQWHQEVRNR